MSELWIPNFSPSHSTTLYDAVLAAQAKVNTSPERYQDKLAQHFADNFSAQIENTESQELLLTTELLFYSEPHKMAIAEAMGIVGCLTSISYDEIEGTGMQLSLDIVTSHIFSGTDSSSKQAIEARVTTPLTSVQHIEHDPFGW